MTVGVNDLSKYQLSFRKADLLALPLSIHDAFEEVSESNAFVCDLPEIASRDAQRAGLICTGGLTLDTC
jgi:hypothetical protein